MDNTVGRGDKGGGIAVVVVEGAGIGWTEPWGGVGGVVEAGEAEEEKETVLE